MGDDIIAPSVETMSDYRRIMIADKTLDSRGRYGMEKTMQGDASCVEHGDLDGVGDGQEPGTERGRRRILRTND